MVGAGGREGGGGFGRGVGDVIQSGVGDTNQYHRLLPYTGVGSIKYVRQKVILLLVLL